MQVRAHTFSDESIAPAGLILYKHSMAKEAQRPNRGLWIGLVAGVILGYVLNLWGPNPDRERLLTHVIDPLGSIFLRGLFITVVPLVFASVAAGMTRLGNMASIRRLGLRLLLFYACTSLIAIFIGQTLVTLVRPGAGVPQELVDKARADMGAQLASLAGNSNQVADSLWPGLVQSLIPRNFIQAMADGQMLAIVFAAIIFGLALLALKPQDAKPLVDVLQAISEACVTIVGWIMRLAPYAVAALIAATLTRFGFGIVRQLGAYLGVVVGAYAIHFFITYGLIARYLIRMPAREFFQGGLPVFLTAFSTSSSNATMPTTIRTLEQRFGVSPAVTSFTVPLGATVNMDGTALFEGVVVIFVAQVFGIDLTIAQQATVIVLVFLTAVGVAGVPGGSLPLIMSVMAATGIPPEGIALILGVDRVLDMGRTVLNVGGDLLCALYLSRVEQADSANLPCDTT
ncbi:MAG: dicarboxylate/amino acid:cation symporter [Verrucomicrobia bacterium]|nr:dicarboxylate/amino acid:cation symporter [Verrucomicrobiota bacterium]